MFTNTPKLFRPLFLFSAISLAFTILTQQANGLVILPVVAISAVHIIVAVAGFLIVPTTFVVKVITKHKFLVSAVIALLIISALALFLIGYLAVSM